MEIITMVSNFVYWFCPQREVLASQHHDDNSVACIEDKAYVLGCRQFCRYAKA